MFVKRRWNFGTPYGGSRFVYRVAEALIPLLANHGLVFHPRDTLMEEVVHNRNLSSNAPEISEGPGASVEAGIDIRADIFYRCLHYEARTVKLLVPIVETQTPSRRHVFESLVAHIFCENFCETSSKSQSNCGAIVS